MTAVVAIVAVAILILVALTAGCDYRRHDDRALAENAVAAEWLCRNIAVTPSAGRCYEWQAICTHGVFGYVSGAVCPEQADAGERWIPRLGASP